VKIVSVIIALTIVARADSAPTAEDLYQAGQVAYDRGDYSTAITSWRAAYALSSASGLLFNIAQAQRLADDCIGALSTYRRFVTTDPTSDRRGLVEDLARELALKCDERPAPSPQHLQPPIDRSHEYEDSRSSRAVKITGITIAGAGAASIAIGLGLGLHAQSIGGEVTRACAVSCDWATQKEKDAAGRRDAAIGYALDGVGIAGILTGAATYYSGHYFRHRRSVSVSSRPLDRGALVTWSGSW
jgi:hypothetical protein